MASRPKWLIWGILAAAVAAAVLIPYRDPGAATPVARADTVFFDLEQTVRTPDNFNWLTPGVKLLHGAHQAMWEPLFILNFATGELEPWLGTAITSNAARNVWTLTLRDGVTWSDGETFDADDVMFTANMVLGSDALTAREAIRFKGQVQAVRKLSPLVVEFQLKQPNATFHIENFGVANFSSFLIVPEHVWRGKDPANFAFFPPIGTGPYRFTSATTQRVIWDRNPNWWGAKAGFRKLPVPKRLVWLETGGQENRAQMLARGDLDAARELELGIFQAIKQRNPKVISWQTSAPYSWTDPCPRQLEINTAVAPWNNIALRRAVADIIDRQQIIDIVYEGGTVVSKTMFVEYGAMRPTIDALVAAGFSNPLRANLPRAKAQIEAAGYRLNRAGIYARDGQPLSVNITTNTASSEYVRTVDILVEQFLRAGINARAVPTEDSVFWGEVLPLGQFEMSYSWLACGSVSEPLSSLKRYTNASLAPIGQRAPGFNNAGRWQGAGADAYSAIVAKIAALPLNAPEVPGLVALAYAHLDREKPFIPLVQSSKVITFNQSHWQGWPSADNFYTHPMHWWGSSHLIVHNLTKAAPDAP